MGKINFVVFLKKPMPQKILKHYTNTNKLGIANPRFLTMMTTSNNKQVIADRTTTIGQYLLVLSLGLIDSVFIISSV